MTAEYNSAKRVALGIEAAPVRAPEPDNLWGVAPAEDRAQALETPFQFFKKEMEAPPIILAHRAALSLFDEYEVDRQDALASLLRLSNGLRQHDAAEITKILKERSLAEWLSYVFIDDNELSDHLIPAFGATNRDCRHVMRIGVQSALEQLVGFKELFNAILDKLEGQE